MWHALWEAAIPIEWMNNGVNKRNLSHKSAAKRWSSAKAGAGHRLHNNGVFTSGDWRNCG